MSKPVIILGGGGHASVLLDLLLNQGREVLAYVSPEQTKNNNIFDDIHWLKNDEYVLSYSPQSIELVNGIGSLPEKKLRSQVYQEFKSKGYTFANVVSENAILSTKTILSEGVQVMPGSIINIGSSIGENTIINSGAIIEHDCKIGTNNHIAPGVTLSGDVTTGDNVHIGTGANVIQAITINNNTTIGAGAVVTTNIGEFTTVYPARVTKKVEKKHGS